MTLEYSTHREGDPLYHSATLRRCPSCKPHDGLTGIHELSMFKRHPREDGKYTVLCRECCKLEEKLTEQKVETAAVTTLTSALAAAKKARKSNGQTFGDVLGIACDAIGGQDRAFKLTGRILGKALRRGLKKDAHWKDIDRAVKAGETLLSSAAAADKNRAQVDLSDLTEEELRDILMEPARQLILSDAMFRKQLLNDVEVRRALLADADVELLEVAG